MDIDQCVDVMEAVRAIFQQGNKSSNKRYHVKLDGSIDEKMVNTLGDKERERVSIRLTRLPGDGRQIRNSVSRTSCVASGPGTSSRSRSISPHSPTVPVSFSRHGVTRSFTVQVVSDPILRILGEMAEWPKAPDC